MSVTRVLLALSTKLFTYSNVSSHSVPFSSSYAKTIDIEQWHKNTGAALMRDAARARVEIGQEPRPQLQAVRIATHLPLEKEPTPSTCEIEVQNTDAELSPALPQNHGIPNRGNTCFLASVLQSWAIFQKPAFEKKLAAATTSENDRHIIRSIIEWINTFETSREEMIDLGPFLGVARNPAFPIGRQQDAAELITWLENFTAEPSTVYHSNLKIDPRELQEGDVVFDGEEMAPRYVRSIPLEVERQIQKDGTLVIKPGQTLLGMISKFFSESDLTEQGAYVERYVQDPTGNVTLRKLRLSSKQDFLSNAPKELTFQIKKFHRDSQTERTHRLDGELEKVQETFEMPAEYFANGSERASYQLRSVIYHIGSSPNNGHYVAYVRKIDPNTGASTFICANDESITPIDPETMMKMATKGYILIYDKLP
jgi:ubiquitin C-terminal hydrolase